MDIDMGRLYDGIAATYDRDAHGLLRLGRNTGLSQVSEAFASTSPTSIVDLGAGTGESLVAMHARYPDATLLGVDVSADMLAVAAGKVPVQVIVDSAEHVAQHVPAASADLVLMHFITTFIDVPATVQACAQVLRPGGYLSIVSTTLGAFPKLSQVALQVATWEEIVSAGPAPANADTLVDIAREAGLEVVRVEEVTKEVVFESAEACFDFGRSSGFFTHLIAAMGEERILSSLPAVASAFPITDRYLAAAVLVRKP